MDAYLSFSLIVGVLSRWPESLPPLLDVLGRSAGTGVVLRRLPVLFAPRLSFLSRNSGPVSVSSSSSRDSSNSCIVGVVGWSLPLFLLPKLSPLQVEAQCASFVAFHICKLETACHSMAALKAEMVQHRDLGQCCKETRIWVHNNVCKPPKRETVCCLQCRKAIWGIGSQMFTLQRSWQHQRGWEWFCAGCRSERWLHCLGCPRCWWVRTVPKG